VEQSAFLRADQPLPYTDASRLFDPSRLKNGFLRVKLDNLEYIGTVIIIWVSSIEKSLSLFIVLYSTTSEG